MRRVIIESPYAPSAGLSTEDHVNYARKAMADSLARGEAPYASHLLYTQVLDDTKPAERVQGIEAGFAWGRQADLRTVYVDHGISGGMVAGIKEAVAMRQPIEFRTLEGRVENIPVAMEGGTYHVPIGKVWTPPDPINTLRDLLAMVSHNVPKETIRRWTRHQRDLASGWAAAVHLAASDNEDIEIPAKPQHLRGFDQPLLGEELPDPSAEPEPDTDSILQTATGATPEPRHLLAMGGKETVCGIRLEYASGLPTTMDRHSATCPACTQPRGKR